MYFYNNVAEKRQICGINNTAARVCPLCQLGSLVWCAAAICQEGPGEGAQLKRVAGAKCLIGAKAGIT
jgi:hypothetical protein